MWYCRAEVLKLLFQKQLELEVTLLGPNLRVFGLIDFRCGFSFIVVRNSQVRLMVLDWEPFRKPLLRGLYQEYP